MTVSGRFRPSMPSGCEGLYRCALRPQHREALGYRIGQVCLIARSNELGQELLGRRERRKIVLRMREARTFVCGQQVFDRDAPLPCPRARGRPREGRQWVRPRRAGLRPLRRPGVRRRCPAGDRHQLRHPRARRRWQRRPEPGRQLRRRDCGHADRPGHPGREQQCCGGPELLALMGMLVFVALLEHLRLRTRPLPFAGATSPPQLGLRRVPSQPRDSARPDDGAGDCATLGGVEHRDRPPTRPSAREPGPFFRGAGRG